MFCVCAAALPSAELVWPGLLALLVAGACSVLVEPVLAELVWLALLPIALELVDDCEAELSDVIAPVVPPVAALVPKEAEPLLEQVSEILVTLDTVITLLEEAAVLLVPLLL